MTKQEKIRVLTRVAFGNLLTELHKNPTERESDLVEVATANYLRLLNSIGVVREVDTRWYASNGKYLNPLTDKPVRVVAVEPLIGRGQ